jgi:hypothetical protein
MGDKDTELLFSDGTLQLPVVQTATFGRLLTGTRGALRGFALADLKIDDEHVVAVSGKAVHTTATFTGRPSDVTPGMVFAVTPAEIQSATPTKSRPSSASRVPEVDGLDAHAAL